MQKITQADIRKFQVLYEHYFEVKLNDDDARAKLSLLILQLERIYKPMESE